MNPERVHEILTTDAVALAVLAGNVAANVSYVGVDGGPRVVPVAWLWQNGQIVTCTPTNAPKLKALRTNPKVAISINLGTFPDQVLLLRCTVDIDVVDGVPPEFIDANARLMPDEEIASFVDSVRGLYREMAILRFTPTWAKALDFVERVPDAIAPN